MTLIWFRSFLVPETDIMGQFLGPETDNLAERYFMAKRGFPKISQYLYDKIKSCTRPYPFINKIRRDLFAGALTMIHCQWQHFLPVALVCTDNESLSSTDCDCNPPKKIPVSRNFEPLNSIFQLFNWYKLQPFYLIFHETRGEKIPLKLTQMLYNSLT